MIFSTLETQTRVCVRIHQATVGHHRQTRHIAFKLQGLERFLATWQVVNIHLLSVHGCHRDELIVEQKDMQ
jgi:hypothetical protein